MTNNCLLNCTFWLSCCSCAVNIYVKACVWLFHFYFYMPRSRVAASLSTWCILPAAIWFCILSGVVVSLVVWLDVCVCVGLLHVCEPMWGSIHLCAHVEILGGCCLFLLFSTYSFELTILARQAGQEAIAICMSPCLILESRMYCPSQHFIWVLGIKLTPLCL